jgi:hypothetical protein
MFRFLEYQTMDKGQEINNTRCSNPSSEPFIISSRLLFLASIQCHYYATSQSDRSLIGVNISSEATRRHSAKQRISLPCCHLDDSWQRVTSPWYRWVSIFVHCSEVYCLDSPSSFYHALHNCCSRSVCVIFQCILRMHT